MTHYFPAAPGTLIATRDMEATHGVVYTPVVGWCHIQGNLAFPIAPLNFGGMTHGMAIVDPGGFVTDPVHMQVFESVEEWVRFIDLAKEPKKANPNPEDRILESTDPLLHPDSPVEDESDVRNGEDDMNARVGPTAAEDKPVQIQFGSKSYKSKSFWKAPYLESIFEIEGGTNYPDDGRVEKITRDDFTTLKKAGWDVIDPRTGVIGEESEEDDGMDLV